MRLQVATDGGLADDGAAAGVPADRIGHPAEPFAAEGTQRAGAALAHLAVEMMFGRVGLVTHAQLDRFEPQLFAGTVADLPEPGPAAWMVEPAGGAGGSVGRRDDLASERRVTTTVTVGRDGRQGPPA